MAELTITVCDICADKSNICEYPNPVTGTLTDRCLDHIPGVYSTSVSGMYYGDAYPSHEDDIDLRFQWLGPDLVQVTFAGDDTVLTRVAVETLVKASEAFDEKVFGCFTVQTDVTLESGDYVSHNFNASELLAFMNHDWSEGDFEY